MNSLSVNTVLADWLPYDSDYTIQSCNMNYQQVSWPHEESNWNTGPQTDVGPFMRILLILIFMVLWLIKQTYQGQDCTNQQLQTLVVFHHLLPTYLSISKRRNCYIDLKFQKQFGEENSWWKHREILVTTHPTKAHRATETGLAI